MNPLAKQIIPHLPWQADHWWLGVSGGLDSVCLMALIHELQQASPYQDYPSLPPITVLHINHGLHSQAPQWADTVSQMAKQYNLDYIAHTVQLDPNLRAKKGEEASARQARYEAFNHYVESSQALLLAHHANDQVETLLLRLFRGSGVKGLGSMPTHRSLYHQEMLNPHDNNNHLTPARLHRPLLSFTRQMLEDYAQTANIRWCDDPSNTDNHYDRNFLRHEIMPKLYQRFPGLTKKAQQTANIMQDTQNLLEDLAKLDASILDKDKHDNSSLSISLPIEPLLTLSLSRRQNLLRWWLSNQGVGDISYATQITVEQLLQAKSDAQPLITLQTGSLRRANGHIIWLDKAINSSTDWQEQTWVWTQAKINKPKHPVAHGHLVTAKAKNTGLRLCIGDTIQVTRRQGGEHCHPQQREHSQSLKKVLQELNVPAWQRYSLPLFYVNGELAMVGDLFICRGFTASENQQGWLWHPSQVNHKPN